MFKSFYFEKRKKNVAFHSTDNMNGLRQNRNDSIPCTLLHYETVAIINYLQKKM